MTMVAVDNGHSQQCVAYLDENNEIQTLVFSSRIEAGITEICLDGDSNSSYQVEGKNFTVGDKVTKPIPLNFREYAVSEMNAVLVNHSITRTGKTGPVQIVTGLPFDYFYERGERNAVFIERVKDSLKKEVKLASGKSLSHQIINHDVMPESTAAYIDYALDLKTGVFKENISGVAVIDVGGGTTDITLIVGGNDQTISRGQSGSINFGTITLRDELKSKIMGQFGLSNLSDSAADHALITKEVKLFGEVIDISHLLKPLTEKMANEIDAFISQKIGDGAELDAMLIVGGGALLLFDDLTQLERV